MLEDKMLKYAWKSDIYMEASDTEGVHRYIIVGTSIKSHDNNNINEHNCKFPRA